MPHSRILLIDDEEKLRGLLARIIRLEDFEVVEAANLAAARKILSKEKPDIILCDVKLPDGNGVEFVKEIKRNAGSPEIILLTAYGNIADGVEAIKSGAYDYLLKGDENEKIIPLLYKVSEKIELQKKLERYETKATTKFSFHNILGESTIIQQAIALAKQVAPTDATVLLTGETGTGKEVFANAIHYNSKRRDQNFVAINCSAFSHELLESELFGHKAGAFTSAIKDKKGLIEEAGKGTLFLDEIGELQHDLQAKLLRFLESGEYMKVGDTKLVKTDVRIIAATNRKLPAMIKEGRFREDLYYRLNVFNIELPSLNDRRTDIKELAIFFIERYAVKNDKRINGISKEALEFLTAHDWQGNIRELKNIIERACIIEQTDTITATSLPLEFTTTTKLKTLSAFDLASVEKLHIQRVLIHTNHNKTETAKLLNIGLSTLYRKMDDYGIC